MSFRRSIRRRREQLGGNDFISQKFRALKRKKENNREKIWRSKFTVKPIIYRAQNGNPRDVRTFLFDSSHILKVYIDYYNLRGNNDEETMYKILMWVIGNLKYVGDEINKGQLEYWQNSEDTIITLKGDCEDGAILIKSLALVAGVPDWKVKIMAGDVVGGGHAYCTYIREDNTQVILDWCYWPNNLSIIKRKKREDEFNYLNVWFSFDKRHGYTPKIVEYSNGKIDTVGLNLPYSNSGS